MLKNRSTWKNGLILVTLISFLPVTGCSNNVAGSMSTTATTIEETIYDVSSDDVSMISSVSENDVNEPDSYEMTTQMEVSKEDHQSNLEELVTELEMDPLPEDISGDVDETADETTTVVTPTTASVTTAQTTTAQTAKAPTTAAKKETTAGTSAAIVKPVSISASVSGTHYGGETLTGADFNVIVTFSDGTTSTNPIGFTASPLTLVTGSNSIVVTYNSVSTTITANAMEKATAAATTAAPTTAAPTTATTTTAVPSTTAPTTEVNTNITVPEGIVDEIGRQAFVIQNQYRSEAGVSQLTWSNELYAIACIRAEEIIADFTHQGKITTGENIHYSTFSNIYLSERLYQQALSEKAEFIMQEWKNSSGHYKALTSPDYKYGAIATYEKAGVLYCVSVFSAYDGFGEYETVCNNASIAAVANGQLSPVDTINDPPDVYKIEYAKMFWYPKQIPNVAGLFNNMTFGDYCNSIGKYQ
jgi:uncharacterized protein YkwD